MATAITPQPLQPGFRLEDGSVLNPLFAQPTWSSQGGLTATAGGAKTGALQLTTAVSRLAVVASSGDSVLLPPALPGKVAVLINGGANPAQVYGQGTDTIDGVATGTGVTLTNAKIALFFCTTAGAWHSMAAGVAT